MLPVTKSDGERLSTALSLAPEGHAKSILRFVVEDLKLSARQAKEVLDDACGLASALRWICD